MNLFILKGPQCDREQTLMACWMRVRIDYVHCFKSLSQQCCLYVDADVYKSDRCVRLYVCLLHIHFKSA